MIAFNLVGHVEDIQHDGNGDGLDSSGWCVTLGICPELSIDSEVDLAGGVLSGIFGPHPGIRLTDSADGVLHCSRSDALLAGSKSSISIPSGKDPKDWDGVLHCAKEGIESVLLAKIIPSVPMSIKGFGSFSSDPGSYLFLKREEVTAEFICLRRGQSVQGSVCGYIELKCNRRLVSSRCQAREHSSAILLSSPGR